MGVIFTRQVDEGRIDPSKRPAGALPVEIVNFAYPRQDLVALLSTGEGDESDESDESDGADAGDAEDIDEDDELDDADIPE
jgi:hypothetical protein